MEGADAELFCSNEDCDFDSSGKCVEGQVDVSQCPFRKPSLSEGGNNLDVPPELSEVEPEAIHGLELGGANPLKIAQASKILSNAPANIIATIGDSGSGKTCLIAAIYDAFQYGNLGHIEFRGSTTLTSFEKIAHYARAASRAGEPNSPRTKNVEDPYFYHLELQDTGVDEQKQLLFADRSGELYELISGTPNLAKELKELKHFDHLNLLVDGEKLAAPSTRASRVARCNQLAYSISQSGVFTGRPRLNIILTKRDCVEQSENKDHALEAMAALVETVKKRCGSHFSEIEYFEIAARPKNNLLSKHYGLLELLSVWLTDPALIESVERVKHIPNRAIGYKPELEGVPNVG